MTPSRHVFAVALALATPLACGSPMPAVLRAPVVSPPAASAGGCAGDLTASHEHCGSCDRTCRPLQACLTSRCVDAQERVVAAGDHACWLRTGRIACWGRRIWDKAGTAPLLLAPTFVRGIDDAVDIAAGDGSMCAVRSSGRVACWGGAPVATCGERSCPTPTDIADVDGAARVFLTQGSYGARACALLASGAVTCWGGTGEGAAKSAPVPGVVDAVDVSVGALETCALRRNGEVVCVRVGVSAPVARLRDAVAISSYTSYATAGTCAVQTTGYTTCWDVSGEFNWKGSNHFPGARSALTPCVITANGTVMCPEGASGDGSPSFWYPRTILEEVSNLTDATGIASGQGFACATRSSGRPVCWGSNRQGTLGIGEPSLFTAPIDAEGIDDAVEVAATAFATCARRRNGTVACWGGNHADSYKPTDVPHVADATHLWGGGRDVCITRSSGGTVCFEAGAFGQVQFRNKLDVPGNPSRATTSDREAGLGLALRGGRVYYFDRRGDTTEASPIVGLDDVTGLDATPCAVRANGDVACWAPPKDLVLGRPVHPQFRRVAIPPAVDLAGQCAVLRSGGVSCWTAGGEATPRTEPNVTDAVSIHGTRQDVCAVLRSGGVWCSRSFVSHDTGARVVQGVSEAVSVTGSSHGGACAVTRAGRVFCWGRNDNGVLARHERQESAIPVEVNEPVEQPEGR